MIAQILDCLRLPGQTEPPNVKAFCTRNGRVIAGAVVSADRSTWAPVLDGVIALAEASAAPIPECSDDLPHISEHPPLFLGHREWNRAADLKVARAPFGPIADGVLTEARALRMRLEAGARVAVYGDDSGWAACSVASELPDQIVIAVIDAAGPLGLSGCRRWLTGSDAPANLTIIVAAGGAKPIAAATVAASIDVNSVRSSVVSDAPNEIEPTLLHALIDPQALVDLNRACIGKRLLSDNETKVLYWIGRAASVAITAARMGQSPAAVLATLAPLQNEGVVRVQRLPAAMARLHVFWRTGEVLLPLAEQSLGTIAQFGFHHFADRVFLHSTQDGSALTYGEAASVIVRTAAALHRDGVRRGDAVCVQAIPHVELPLLFWACVHIGAVFVPLSSLWSREIATHILERCRPKVLFVNDEILDRVPEEWHASAIRLDGSGRSDEAASPRLFSDWLDAPVGTGHLTPATYAAPEEPAVILFTSGTTGVPKGSLLSNASVVSHNLIAARDAAITEDDVFFTVVEAVSPGGLRAGFIMPVLSGGATVITDAKRRGNVLGVAEICRDYGVTVFKAVPATLNKLRQIRDRLPSDTFAALRVIFSASSPLHQQTLNEIGALCTARVIDQMGGTEAPGALVSDPSFARSSVFVHGGYPQDAIAQTTDHERRVIRDGAVGRLRYYGDRVMIEYLADPERTAEVMQDGWFYTGDMGRWEPNGPLRISGRAIEMIKSTWGDKVFPAEIETAMMADPQVREVAACGYTDSDGIEHIAAFVVPGSPPKDPEQWTEKLKNGVRNALGDSKVPRVIMIVEDMPRLAREKIDKRELVTKYLKPCD